MRKLMYLTVACAAFLFASCGSGNNQNNSTEGTSDTETTSPEANASGTSTTTSDEAVSNTINLTGNDQMQFNKTSLTVKAGEPITLTLKNIGKLPAAAMSHDVVVLKPGSDVKTFGQAATQARDIDKISDDLKDEMIAHTKLLGPGEQDKITFTLKDPGTYPFLCSFPGHYPTMHGTIVAK